MRKDSISRKRQKNIAIFYQFSTTYYLVVDADLQLDEILHKMYFQMYSFKDVKPLLQHALAKIKNFQSFFELLYQYTKNYVVVLFVCSKSRIQSSPSLNIKYYHQNIFNKLNKTRIQSVFLKLNNLIVVYGKHFILVNILTCLSYSKINLTLL